MLSLARFSCVPAVAVPLCEPRSPPFSILARFLVHASSYHRSLSVPVSCSSRLCDWITAAGQSERFSAVRRCSVCFCSADSHRCALGHNSHSHLFVDLARVAQITRAFATKAQRTPLTRTQTQLHPVTAKRMAAPASASSVAASSAASSSPSPSAPSKHAALAFFDSHPSSFPNLLAALERGDQSWLQLGRTQLAAALGCSIESIVQLESDPGAAVECKGGWLPSEAAEQIEVAQFLEWASGPAQALVRQVVEDLPAAVYAAQCGGLVSRAELIDLSPKGRVDDEIFEKHRDVWERITRGCAVLRLTPTAAAGMGAQPILRWAVRANRKFTGHEDESEVALDGALYCVDDCGVPATQVVVSHKCNGSVLHLAARDLTLWGQAQVTRWVFLGSKKVHVGCTWNRSAASHTAAVEDWLTKMRLFAADRHEYVSEMVDYIAPLLRAPKQGSRMLDALARFRLVINAEYVSSVGTGPTDNARIYNLPSDASSRRAFGFMLTLNTLSPSAESGLQLCVDFMYALWMLREWGVDTVSAFVIPLEGLPQAKAAVIPLQDIEGAVLYYSNAAPVRRDGNGCSDSSSSSDDGKSKRVIGGILQLEKWKSSNYVIVRAVREKLKPFIFGTRAGQLGVEALLEKLDRDGAAAAGSNAAADTLRITKVLWSTEQLAAEAAAQARAKALGQKAGQKRSNKNKRAAKAAAAANEAAAVLAAQKAVGNLAIADAAASSSSASASSSAAAAASASDDADSADESKDQSSAASSASVAPAPAEEEGGLFLECSHPELDLLGSTLTELGARRLGEGGRWRLRCPASPEQEAALQSRLRDAYAAAVLHRPFTVALQKVTEKVQGRIRAIDHIPLSDAERARWIDDAAAFLKWLLHQIVAKRRWEPKEVMAQYSQLWTFFREEEQAEQEAAQAATAKQKQ